MNKTTSALKLAEEALVYHTQQTRPIQKTDEALAAIREALEEQEKQEPVAWRCRYCNTDISTEHASDCPIEIYRLPNPYAAPVSAEAIRAEALEEAAKVCDNIENDHWNLYKGRPPYTGSEAGRADPHEQGVSMGAGECAAAIRGMK